MNVEQSCKTPTFDNKTDSSSTPIRIRTPLSSSKRLFTPCRQVGLRRTSAKKVSSPAITKNDTAEMFETPYLSSLDSASKNEGTTKPPLKKHSAPEDDTSSAKQNDQICVEVKKNEKNTNSLDNKNYQLGNSIEVQHGGNEDGIPDLDSALNKEKSELTVPPSLVLPDMDKFKTTPKLSSRKRHYPFQLRSVSICQIAGENKIKSDKSAQSNSPATGASTNQTPLAKNFKCVETVLDKENPGGDSRDRILALKRNIKKHKEQLRVLKLAKLYRKKVRYKRK